MSAPTLAGKLVVAISSRALFDLTESHRVYTELGVESYHRYQIEHEDELLAPGPAFSLVTKLLRLNQLSKQYVEVILLSRNSADTGLRVFKSIEHHGLEVTRAAFTKGESTSRYVRAFGAHLFLSADTDDVRRALEDGYAAATIFPSVFRNETDELRIAFDGDAVLFSDEAERVYQASGLAAFAQSEREAAARPLSGGPFKDFLAALHRIQADFPEDASPIRTALVTARSAPAHERVIRTLRAWNIRIDEALFLGGLDKGEFLRAMLMALPAQGDEYKIGVLHVERILQQSSSAKAAHDRIEQEFKARDADIGRKEQEVRDTGAQLEKTRATLSADARTAQERTLEARTREVQRLRQVFAEDLRTRQFEELDKLKERLDRVLTRYAKERNFDLILQDALYVGKAVDITDDIIKALEAPPGK